MELAYLVSIAEARRSAIKQAIDDMYTPVMNNDEPAPFAVHRISDDVHQYDPPSVALRKRRGYHACHQPHDLIFGGRKFQRLDSAGPLPPPTKSKAHREITRDLFIAPPPAEYESAPEEEEEQSIILARDTPDRMETILSIKEEPIPIQAPQAPESEEELYAMDVMGADIDVFEAGVWDKVYETIMSSDYYVYAVKPAAAELFKRITSTAFRERLVDFCEAGVFNMDFCQVSAHRHDAEVITCACCDDCSVGELRLSGVQVRLMRNGDRDRRRRMGPQKFSWEIGVCCRYEVIAILQIYHMLYAFSRPKGNYAYQGFDLMGIPEGITYGSPDIKDVMDAHAIIMAQLVSPQAMNLEALLYAD